MKRGRESAFSFNKDIRGLQDIHTPIITIMGSGRKCNKLDLQLEIRKQLLYKGYKVSSISSRKFCIFEGMHSYPNFMDSLGGNERTKILSYGIVTIIFLRSVQ